MVVGFVWLFSSNRKKAVSSISAQMHHMQENDEKVRKCAKVKGRLELKIDRYPE